MTRRRRFSERALWDRLAEFGHVCAECAGKVGGSFGLEWDHIRPLAMGGEDEIPNLQPLCKNCHRAKTSTDQGHIAKGKRMEKRSAGIKRQARSPILGSKGTGWRKPINGPAVRVKE